MALVLTFESVDEILKRDHSNERSSAEPSRGTVYCDVQLLSLRMKS